MRGMRLVLAIVMVIMVLVGCKNRGTASEEDSNALYDTDRQMAIEDSPKIDSLERDPIENIMVIRDTISNVEDWSEYMETENEDNSQDDSEKAENHLPESKNAEEVNVNDQEVEETVEKTVKKTEENVTEKVTEKGTLEVSPILTYEEYMTLSSKERQEYIMGFDTMEEGMAWYEKAREQYNGQKEMIEIKEEINIDDIIKEGEF